ncbi:MAG: hypothetical protein L3K00_05910 [Thermoplasmata archaeon]|nr:hypothetical protein [Thermoplasmata archaeon]
MDRSTPAPEFGDRAAAFDRAFVLALGGFALEVAGASLVTHERIPVPRFNHVLVGAVGPDRQTAFFERALDHYFQRALRPTFRIPEPVPDHLDAGLRRFSFRARAAPYTVLWARPRATEAASRGLVVRQAGEDDLDAIVGLWTGEREHSEFRRSLDVAWNHPNPGDRFLPLLAEDEGASVGGAVVYEHDGVAGLHGVATVPGARGRGVATSLVAFASGVPEVRTSGAVVLASDSPKAIRPLEGLGFTVLRRFREYELPPDAALTLPDPGPPQPPRWRPPRPAH